MTEAYANQPFRVHSDLVNYAQRAMDKQREVDKATHGEDDAWFKHRTYYVEAVDPDDLPIPD